MQEIIEPGLFLSNFNLIFYYCDYVNYDSSSPKSVPTSGLGLDLGLVLGLFLGLV